MIRVFHRTSMVFLSVIALLAMTVGIASAHAKIKSSEPAADSTVASAPTQVKVVFDNHDPLDISGSSLVVTDESGAVVDLGDTALDKNDADRLTLVVSLKSGLANGTYTVKWTALSQGDGSVTEGSFKFTVDAAAAVTPAPAAEAPTQLPRTGAGDSLPMMALFSGVVLIGAGLLIRSRLARVN